MPDISDELIKKAAQGDLEAFEQIYQGLSGFVFNVAYRVTSHREDAQEVLQEVFVTVYQKIKSFQFQSSFKTWIYRVTVNTAINFQKKNSRHNNRSVEFNEQVEVAGEESTPGDNMDQQYYEQMVTGLLDKLSAEHRACIVLRNLQGLSYQDIAQVLGININTVRSRLKRAREALLAMKAEVKTYEL